MNRNGAADLLSSIQKISSLQDVPEDTVIVDTRGRDAYNAGHIHGALHIAESGLRFETWLGTIVRPDEAFVLVVQDDTARERVLKRVAKIGYEQNVQGVYVGNIGDTQGHIIDLDDLLKAPETYTILDVRQPNEHEDTPLFQTALNIPLNTLREETDRIPAGKPIAVHCAGGYRSMVAASLLEARRSESVFDIGEHIHALKT